MSSYIVYTIEERMCASTGAIECVPCIYCERDTIEEAKEDADSITQWRTVIHKNYN
jgi:hypothetical protein